LNYASVKLPKRAKGLGVLSQRKNLYLPPNFGGLPLWRNMLQSEEFIFQFTGDSFHKGGMVTRKS